MEKKLIHGLPIPFAQTTLIDHDDMPIFKIVYGKNLSWSRRPSEKSHF
jgi:hypothetical protein